MNDTGKNGITSFVQRMINDSDYYQIFHCIYWFYRYCEIKKKKKLNNQTKIK